MDSITRERGSDLGVLFSVTQISQTVMIILVNPDTHTRKKQQSNAHSTTGIDGD